MSDVRSLLKAKRVERGAPTKQRIAAVRRDDAQVARPKRKLEASVAASEHFAASASSKGPEEKRRRVEEHETPQEPSPGGFPADFFSDSSRTLPAGADNDDEESAQPNESSNITSSISALAISSSSNPHSPPSSSIDAEFEAFERAIQKAAQAKPPDPSVFTQATVSAEPQLVTEVPDGFPPSVIDRNEEVLVSSSAALAPEEPEVDETEVDKFKRKEREDKELVIDRLLEEERVQEEADAKVSALKARLEAIKQKRAAKKAAS